ncbi:MAG: class I SAM-dependent methyltransferase [Gemmataceae bacterium]|nr:class I SAM-dependent methyltransferase [Gemmataceae bacterium]
MSAVERARATGGPAVIDALAHDGRDPLIESYEQGFRAEAGEPLAARLGRAPLVVQAAYRRRAHLLGTLPLGDLTGKVCVDFGVGGLGFGHGFPALQRCTRAIGIDFSIEAIKASAAVSAGGGFPYGQNCTYLTSRGDRIDLPDGSADVVHACDSVERVENVDALLEEFHRILKPGGLLVLTTAQAAPEAPCTFTVEPAPLTAPIAPEPRRGLMARFTARKAILHLGQMVRATPPLRRLARFVKRRLVGPAPTAVAPLPGVSGDSPDHLGTLTCSELLRLLGTRFEVVQAYGYGGPVGETVPALTDAAAAEAWAAQFAEQPEKARGIVLLARRRDDYRRGGCYRQRRFPHDSLHVRYNGGPWEVTGLHRTLTGRLSTGGEEAWLTLPVEGRAVMLHFWSNPWGGEAVIDVGGVRRTVNLYNPGGCFKRVLIDGLAPGRHELCIAGSRNRDPRSCGNQVIFYQATAYQRDGAPPATNERHSEGRVIPERTPEETERLRQKVGAREWFHTIDLGDGIVTRGCDHSAAKVGYLGLPERLDGLSVLDIGAYDGFFSFECERRGAKRVVAADHFCWTYGGMATKEGFDTAKAALGSKVEEVLIPVEEIGPERVGTHDLVLFLGVLYHAPDMIRYLRMVRSVCRGQVILETEVDALDYPKPAAVFYPGESLNNDASNFWGPNLACVEAMLREVGFRKVERVCVFNMVRRGNRPFHRVVYHAFV